MRVAQFIAVTCVLGTLVSCAQLQPPHLPPEKVERPEGPLPPSTRPTYNLSGYPPATREGYIDGCETAKQSPYGYKDNKRYADDGQYRMGWDDGFDMCRVKR